MLRSALLSTAIAVISTVAFAQDAHVHGEAELSVAIDGTGVLVEVHVPGESIVGFEHAPKNDAEQKAVDDATSILESSDLFAFTAAAGCRVDHAHADLEIEGEHSEFHIEHEFECADTGAITTISTNLFDAFLGIEEMHTEVTGPNGTSTGDWESDSASFSL